MRTFILLFAVLLAGCDEWAGPEHASKASELCDRRGGVNKFTPDLAPFLENQRRITVLCTDGTKIVHTWYR